MNVNQLIARVVWAFIGIGLVVVIALSVGCASKSQMTIGPVTELGQVITFEGPQAIEMSVKTDKVDAKYSGKSEGFWAGVFKFLLMKAPEITVIK